MSPWAPLYPLRIGCVQYLNAKPLIEAYDGEVLFAHPSELAVRLAAGELDAGLVPVFEALGVRHYPVVDGVAIGCDGPVYSVFLAHRKPLAEIRSVALDPGSLTSVHLLQVLLGRFHGIRPRCRDAREFPQADAQLLIGNQAIGFRAAHGEDFHYLDLGEEWKRCTGLPFVFAVWMLRPGVADLPAVAGAFRELKHRGLGLLEQIAGREPAAGRGFARRYLTEHISFDLGGPQRQAIGEFRDLLAAEGFLRGSGSALQFV